MVNKSVSELKELFRYRRRNRAGVTAIATQLAKTKNHELIFPEWLTPTPKDKIPKSERIAYPKPPKGPGNSGATCIRRRSVVIGLLIACNCPDGSLLYEKVPNAVEVVGAAVLNNLPPAVTKKRVFDDINGRYYLFLNVAVKNLTFLSSLALLENTKLVD